MKKNSGVRRQESGEKRLAVCFCILTSVFYILLFSGCGGGGGGDTPATTNPGGQQKAKTTITITSKTPGMSVYLNDTLYGSTPFFSESIPAGTYALKLVPPSGAEVVAPLKTDTLTLVEGLANSYSYTPDTTANQPDINWGKYSAR